MSMMKIVTCNLPEPFIQAMARIISEYGLYPSRSELIRVALREFIIKELKILEKFQEYDDPDAGLKEDVNIVQSPSDTMPDMRTIRSFHQHYQLPPKTCSPPLAVETAATLPSGGDPDSAPALARQNIRVAEHTAHRLLKVLSEFPNQNKLSQLATKMNTTQQAIGHALRQLRDLRYVTPDPANVALTERGRAKAAELLAVVPTVK